MKKNKQKKKEKKKRKEKKKKKLERPNPDSRVHQSPRGPGASPFFSSYQIPPLDTFESFKLRGGGVYCI